MPPTDLDELERRALAALEEEQLAADTAALLQVPSITGDERAVVERFAELAQSAGLHAEVHHHDLAALRADPGHPGEESDRHELMTAIATLPGGDQGAGRLCINGHLDVVAPGTGWAAGPWSGARTGDWLIGRGAVDMKSGVVAALHAVAAVRAAGGAPAELVVQAVPGEEDGGLGTFAELRRDARYDACVIPEPTELDVVVAQAGALTFSGMVRGSSTHAALRGAGVSAIDRYVPIHAAIAAHEAQVNARVTHPLMQALDLPYPILVGQVRAGRWSSTVPDELWFEGRLGVPVGDDLETARRRFERAVADATDERGPAVELAWSGGQFASGETPADHPLVTALVGAASAELGRTPQVRGVPYGADLRQFTARGIPCAMFGVPGLALAHAIDERVRVADVAAVARTLVRLAVRFDARVAGGPLRR